MLGADISGEQTNIAHTASCTNLLPLAAEQKHMQRERCARRQRWVRCRRVSTHLHAAQVQMSTCPAVKSYIEQAVLLPVHDARLVIQIMFVCRVFGDRKTCADAATVVLHEGAGLHAGGCPYEIASQSV